MTNMVNAANAERREWLTSHLILHTKAPAGMIKAEVDEAPEEHFIRAYEACVFGKATLKKVIYLLGGNDPAKCPYGNVESTPQEFLKGDMAQQFNESQEQPDVFDDQDPDGL